MLNAKEEYSLFKFITHHSIILKTKPHKLHFVVFVEERHFKLWQFQTVHCRWIMNVIKKDHKRQQYQILCPVIFTFFYPTPLLKHWRIFFFFDNPKRAFFKI